MSKQCCDSPVANAGGESVATGADLHGHDFRHVDPGDGPKGEGEDAGYEEDEEDAGDGEGVVGAGGVLGVDGGFADEGDGDADGAEKEWFAAADAVEEEDDEDGVCLVVSALESKGNSCFWISDRGYVTYCRAVPRSCKYRQPLGFDFQ